jgi:hypothetical protein
VDELWGELRKACELGCVGDCGVDSGMLGVCSFDSIAFGDDLLFVDPGASLDEDAAWWS